MLDLFPEQASTFAVEIDRIYTVLTVLSLLFAVPIAALIVYFGVRYRRGANVDRTGALTESTRLELSWILLLVVLSIGVYIWSTVLYVRMYAMPDDALDIYVLGRQWMWQISYPTGQREINVLHVPVGRPVRLTMISQDVIHSFYVPAFRTKHDVVPGRYSMMWFEATEPGEYDIFCAEYCGTEHSGMVGKVIALEPRQYEEWLRTHAVGGADPIPEASAGAPMQAPQTMAEVGEQLFVNLGCNTCHLPTGQGIGPSLVGLLGSEVALESGETLVADAGYIRRSILDPRAQIVAGYPRVMPTYEGQIDEQELFSLVEYIRSLDTAAEAAPAGEQFGDDEPDDTGDASIDTDLSGDQPDAADNDPTNAEADEDN